MQTRIKSNGQQLSNLAEYLRIVADSLEPMQSGQPPPAAAYRLHVRMDKVKGGLMAPTLSYWQVLTLQLLVAG